MRIFCVIIQDDHDTQKQLTMYTEHSRQARVASIQSSTFLIDFITSTFP